MPAKSKKQQKFMGMVHACQKKGKCASKEVAKTAKSMKKKDAKDFASTKHKGLPEKRKRTLRRIIGTSRKNWRLDLLMIFVISNILQQEVNCLILLMKRLNLELKV